MNVLFTFFFLLHHHHLRCRHHHFLPTVTFVAIYITQFHSRFFNITLFLYSLVSSLHCAFVFGFGFMDSREPPHAPPHHPQGHQFQPPSNVVLVGPNPFTNTAPTTMMAPATARFPLFNMNANPANPPPHSEPFTTITTTTNVNTAATTNTVPPSTLVPYVAGTSESFKRKRGRPRKYFPDDSTALGLGSGSGSGSGSGQALAMNSPDSSTAKKSKRGRGRPRGSVKKKLGMLILNLFFYLLFEFWKSTLFCWLFSLWLFVFQEIMALLSSLMWSWWIMERYAIALAFAILKFLVDLWIKCWFSF